MSNRKHVQPVPSIHCTGSEGRSLTNLPPREIVVKLKVSQQNQEKGKPPQSKGPKSLYHSTHIEIWTVHLDI